MFYFLKSSSRFTSLYRATSLFPKLTSFPTPPCFAKVSYPNLKFEQNYPIIYSQGNRWFASGRLSKTSAYHFCKSDRRFINTGNFRGAPKPGGGKMKRQNSRNEVSRRLTFRRRATKNVKSSVVRKPLRRIAMKVKLQRTKKTTKTKLSKYRDRIRVVARRSSKAQLTRGKSYPGRKIGYNTSIRRGTKSKRPLKQRNAIRMSTMTKNRKKMQIGSKRKISKRHYRTITPRTTKTKRKSTNSVRTLCSSKGRRSRRLSTSKSKKNWCRGRIVSKSRLSRRKLEHIQARRYEQTQLKKGLISKVFDSPEERLQWFRDEKQKAADKLHVKKWEKRTMKAQIKLESVSQKPKKVLSRSMRAFILKVEPTFQWRGLPKSELEQKYYDIQKDWGKQTRIKHAMRVKEKLASSGSLPEEVQLYTANQFADWWENKKNDTDLAKGRRLAERKSREGQLPFSPKLASDRLILLWYRQHKKAPVLERDTDLPVQPPITPGADPQIEHAIHEIRITNQEMYLFPSIEEERFQIMQQLFAY